MAVTIAVGHAGAAGAQDSASTTLAASADTYADESFPSQTNGGESLLRVDGDPGRHAYLRFEPVPPAGEVQSATLRVYATGTHAAGFEVRATDTGWDEQTLTWNARPGASSEVLARSGPLTAGQWASIDVTGHVGQGGSVAFALTGTAEESVYVAARERGADVAPRLVLTTQADGGGTPPDDGGSLPPDDGGSLPPDDGGSLPPDDGGSLPPGSGGTPPDGGGTPPNRVSCDGYPEPRVFLESQSWWYDSRALSDGQSSHAHSGACFPLNQALTGTFTLDVRSMIHNEPAGTRLEFVRVQAMHRGGGVTNLAIMNPKSPCNARDCTFWNQISVDLSSLPRSGLTEFRLHTETERPDGSRQLATGGWLAWVDNGAPRSTSTATRWPATEGRGWYQKPGEAALGYENALLRSTVPTEPVCGRWPVKIETKAGAGGQRPTATRVLLDPNLHAVPEDPGRVIYETAGHGAKELVIDTALLADGPHKLVIVSKADENVDERLAGAQVIPFEVDNSLGCAPPPAVDPMFPEGAVLSGSPTDTADVFLDAFAPGASAVEYWVDGERVGWDESSPEFDEFWDVDSVAAGHHQLVVKAAIDGQVHESAPRLFCVVK